MQLITNLVGNNFRDEESRAALAELSADLADPATYYLSLFREPENPYDSSAVKVLLTLRGREYFIGYLPASDNKDLAMVLDAISDNAALTRAVQYGLLAEGHTPTIDRVEILNFINGPKKPSLVIEYSTGFELGTLVRGPDNDASGEPDYLPRDGEV